MSKVLIACEFSGRVRDAFTARGHDATSCDLLSSETPGKHYQGDVRDIINDGWDMLIAHPPCTHLCVSGARWFEDKAVEQDEAVAFFRLFWYSKIPRIAIENPIGVLSTFIKKPDQIVQPWQFGHGESKATCFWLRNLPKLSPTQFVKEREQKILSYSPSDDRWMKRSRTYGGIAEAMAIQWGRFL